MGNNFATELADNDLFDLDLETQIGIHLSSNHYPPVPSSMIAPCIEAIDAYHNDNSDLLIDLPDGILWRGETSAPAYSIIEAHHLGAWCYNDEC